MTRLHGDLNCSAAAGGKGGRATPGYTRQGQLRAGANAPSHVGAEDGRLARDARAFLVVLRLRVAHTVKLRLHTHTHAQKGASQHHI